MFSGAQVNFVMEVILKKVVISVILVAKSVILSCKS